MQFTSIGLSQITCFSDQQFKTQQHQIKNILKLRHLFRFCQLTKNILVHGSSHELLKFYSFSASEIVSD